MTDLYDPGNPLAALLAIVENDAEERFGFEFPETKAISAVVNLSIVDQLDIIVAMADSTAYSSRSAVIESMLEIGIREFESHLSEKKQEEFANRLSEIRKKRFEDEYELIEGTNSMFRKKGEK